MFLKRVLPKPKNSAASRNLAVFTALFLIFVALVVARILPEILSTSNEQSLAAELAVSGFFLFISWDMVEAMVGGSIDEAIKDIERRVKEEIDAIERRVKEEIDAYEIKHSSEAIRQRLYQEFYASIPQESRNGSQWNPKPWEEHTLVKIKKKYSVKQSIIKGLGEDDRLLNLVALKACRKVMGLEHASDEEIKNNQDLTIFRNDIYIYLKAWLMFSIQDEREMPIQDIKHSYPNEENPNNEAYVEALEYILNELINRERFQEKIEKEHRSDATSLIKDYLSRLIRTLRSNL